MVRVLYQAIAAPVPVPALAPELVSEDRWHQGWSEPMGASRRNAIAGAAIALIASGATMDPFPRPITAQTADMWAYPWSEPARVKPGISAAAQDWLGRFPQTAPETVSFDRFGFAWSEPVRVKPGIQAAATPSHQAPVLTPSQDVEEISFDRWAFPWSEPVRFAPRLLAGAQPAGALTEFSPFLERVSFDKFGFAWSNPSVLPQERPARLAPHLMPAFFDTRTSIVPELTLAAKWFQPLSEPARVKPVLFAGHQPSEVLVEFAPFLERVSFDKWAFAWSEPVRIKPGLIAALHPVSPDNPFGMTQPERVSFDKWAFAWSEPVRIKPGILAALQLSAADGSFLELPGYFALMAITEAPDVFGFSVTVRSYLGSLRLTDILTTPDNKLRKPDKATTQ